MKREAYSARGGSHVTFSESQSLSEPLCFQGQASQVNGQETRWGWWGTQEVLPYLKQGRI